MKRTSYPKGLALAFGLIGLIAMAGSVSAQGLACYKWSIFPEERFRLDVKLHSILSVDLEERNFVHPDQDAFSIHGKHVGVCGGDSMATVTGTAVRATPGSGLSTNTGAHLGLRTHSVRATAGAGIFCKEVTLDCTTLEKTPTPLSWVCFSRNEWDVTHAFPSTLSLVDPTVDPRCSIFQDGTPTPHATGGASGLQNP